MITTSAHGKGFTVTCMGLIDTTLKEQLERDAADFIAGMDEHVACDVYFVLKRRIPPSSSQSLIALQHQLWDLGKRKMGERQWAQGRCWFRLGHVA